MASCGRERRADAVSLRQGAARAFLALPPGFRRAVLHGLGRYAPWEDGFDFTPPAPGPGEETGPPDFVGIGVQKAGTTWWHELVAAHPRVASRRDVHKERHFFDRFALEAFGPSDVEGYHGWFPRPHGVLAGEWTPDYLAYPWVPPLLKAAAPDARLLVLVRDPIERLRSGLAHQARLGLKLNGSIIADAVERGFYHRALSDWLEHFDLGQVLVLQYERCLVDLDRQLDATFAFIGVDAYRVPEAQRPPWRDRGPRTALQRDVALRLVEIYSPDVIMLADRLPTIDLRLWPNFSHLTGFDSGPEPASSGRPSSPTMRR